MRKLVIILSAAMILMGMIHKAVEIPAPHYKPYFTGPVPRYLLTPGEYFNSLLDGNSVGYNVVGKPATVIGWPSVIAAMASGTHGQIVTDGTSVWTSGDNNSYGQGGTGATSSSAFGPTNVTADSLGISFSNITQVGSGGTITGWTNWLVEHGTITDTLFATGCTDGGLHVPGPASGQNTKFVKIFYVTGEHIKKVQMDVFAFVLTASGKLYDWGGSNSGFAPQYCLAQGTSSPATNTPTLIAVPGGGSHTWVDIAGGSFWNYFLRDDGHLYGSAYYAGYLGVGTSGQVYNQPNAINTLWDVTAGHSFPHPVAKVYTNGSTSYAILSDSTLWAWGDNALGGFGVGTELNYATYANGTSSAIYNWDQGLGELFSQVEVQIAPGKHNFTDVFVSNALNYFMLCQDAFGQVFTCGRNKGGVAGDGSVGAGGSGAIGATYPNTWDNVYLKLVTPWATSTFPVTCPYCIANPSGSPCNNYTIPTHSAPTTVFSIRYTGGLLILDGSGSHDASGTIYHCIFRQTAGTALQMGVQDAPKDTIYGAVPGQTYTFRNTTINPTWDSTAVTTPFTIPNGCVSCIPLPPGSILPKSH